LTAILLVATSVTASTVGAPIKPVVVPVEDHKQPLNAPRSVEELIVENSIKYGVSASVMRRVIKCESSGNPNAVGDFGQSFGLVQIHAPSHPYVTRAQALDPEFAVEFLAKNLALGKGSMWTCWRMLIQ